MSCEILNDMIDEMEHRIGIDLERTSQSPREALVLESGAPSEVVEEEVSETEGSE